MSNETPKTNFTPQSKMLDTVKKPSHISRYWRDIFALAWKETELLSKSKLLTTLGVSTGALVFQYELSVRTLSITIQIISTVVVAYLVIASIGYLWNVITTAANKDEKVRRENKGLKERLRPNLAIIFKPNQAPFRQVYSGHDDLPVTQYRVCVVSPVSIADVELVVNKLVIRGVDLSGCHLRPRHERDDKRGGTRRVALKAFKEDAWDVISMHPEEGVVLNAISLHGLILIPSGKYQFELMASGGNNPPATKIANLDVRADNSVVFQVCEGRLSERLI